MNDDIELVEIDFKENQRKNKTKVKKNMTKTKNTKKSKKKFKTWEKIFIGVSLAFCFGCLIFYGTRLIKYYRIYNPKMEGEAVELISNAIVKNTEIKYEGDGLYRYSGAYVYKGSSVNNYMEYSNMLWRIVKFNNDGSADLVLEDNINMMKWDDKITDVTDSDIFKYLNSEFYNKLDKEYLTKTGLCTDKVTDLNEIKCDNRHTDDYVRLLTVADYLNTKSESSYIDEGNIWLANTTDEKVWNISDKALSKSDADEIYYVKPVVTIKNSTQLLEGEGTKDNPYKIQKERTLGVGSYVKLGSDTWYIYDSNDNNLYLSLNKTLDARSFGSTNVFDPKETNTLAYYLNNDYLNSLSYKDKIQENKWYIGNYKTYSDITSKEVSSKVGMLSIADIKNNNVTGYYLLTPSTEGKVYLYSEDVLDSKSTLKQKVVPTIVIKKGNTTGGTGTSTDPFVVE